MKSTAFLLMIISALSKLFGFAREMVFSYYFGTGITKDAYVIATAIPTILAGFVGTALTIGNIPIYTRENKKGRKYGDLFTSRIANLILIIVMIFIAFVLLYPQGIVKLIAGGYEGEVLKLTIDYMKIMVFSLIIISLFSLYQGYLNANNSFILSAVAPFSMNVVIILFTIAAGVIDTIYLPIGFLISYIVQFLFIMPGLKKYNYHYTFSFQFKNESVKDFVKLATPMMFALIISNIANLIDNNIASYIMQGGVSALDYAYRLIGIVTGILIFPITTAIYPTMSRIGTNRDIKGLKDLTMETATTISLLNIPSIVGMMVLSVPIVTAIYARGAFGQESIEMTSSVLLYYSPMLIGMGITDVFNRAFYSLEDTRTPVIVSGISMIVDIIMNFVLSYFMGLPGLALSSSIGRLVNALLLVLVLRHRIGPIGLRKMTQNLLKITVSSLLMGVFAYFSFNLIAPKLPQLLALSVVVVLAVILYFIELIFFKVLDIQKIRDAVVNKFIKK